VTAQSIATARSQTQVTDGFFVKDTHKLSETIEYLRLLTEVIVEAHQVRISEAIEALKFGLMDRAYALSKNAPLHVIPSRYISRGKYNAFQSHLRQKYPATPCYTTLEAFQSLNTKAANRTLQETWARMMLCVKQMSSERVAACLSHWKTPRELHEWLREQERLAAAQEDDSSRSSAAPAAKGRKKVRGIDMVFADTVQGEGRQKIGDQMSRDVSLLSVVREAGLTHRLL
jgi:crossover junction endonuclease MUS81